jgi:predicted Ser/Thr protein kinase
MASFVELINDAFVDRRTVDGKRVSFTLHEMTELDAERPPVHATLAFLDDNGTVVDMRTWEIHMPRVDEARAAAFVAGLRAMPLDVGAMYPDEFPPWDLLDIASLQSAEDFVRVMSSREVMRATLATAFVASLLLGTGSSSISSGDALRLYDIRMCTVSQAALESHVDALARSAPHALLQVLEKWPDDGVVTDAGGWMRMHLASRALPVLAKRVDAALLARLGVSMPPDVDAVFRNASKVIDVGAIELDASGRVIVADPYFADVRAIKTGAAAAHCPVRLALTTLPDWGERVSFARLDLRADARASAWRATGHRFFVDAGLACFMTVARRDAFRAELDACHARGANHYEAVLHTVLHANGGKWGMHDGAAIFASGIGDGAYEVLEGVDDQGHVVSLAIDFAILDEADAHPTEVHLEKTRFGSVPTFTGEAPLEGGLDERFERIRLLGTGGVGEVFLARDRVLDREVALKVMKRVPHTAVPSLLDEARAMSLVRHENVVALLDAGAHKGDVFIALEYVEGTNLRQQMKRGMPVERTRALQVLRHVARGLAAAHAVDVLHLDVKPENVLVGVDGVSRVVDFGLARLRSGNACIELSGAPSGTPAYMAPELWASEGVCDGTDVWSYAVLAHEVLAGTRPFEASTSGEMMALILAGLTDAQRGALGFGGVSAPLAELLRNSLVRNRRARPTMREIEAALS